MGGAAEQVALVEGRVKRAAAYFPKDNPELKQRLRDTPGLLVKSGEMRGQIVLLEELPFRIGRGPNNHLQLGEAQVDLSHAVVTKNAEGQFVISGIDEGSCTLLYRYRGRFRKKNIIPLDNNVTVQLGMGGPRIQYRFLGRTAKKSELPTDEAELKALQAPLIDLSPNDLRRGLIQLLAVSRLNEQERLVVDESARAIKRYKWLRWIASILLGFSLITVAAVIGLNTARIASENELVENQKKWTENWGNIFIEGEELEAGGVVLAPEVALDPVTGQIQQVMDALGFPDYPVDVFFLRRVKDEIDREVRRIKDANLDNFLKRYSDYHPQLELMFERNYGLPRSFAYLGWVLSDYRLDLRDEKALGMWQFQPDTAIQYGLIVDGADFRQDFAQSSKAAGEYMTDLVTIFGMENFDVALAAYQGGWDRVLAAYEENRLWRNDQRTYERLCPLGTDYKNGVLGEDACRFPMRFLAAAIIGQNQGFHLKR